MTLIRYALPKDAEVKLEVYNIRGERVLVLVNGRQKAGHKKITWDAKGFASGIYLCRLQAGKRIMVKKMVLLK